MSAVKMQEGFVSSAAEAPNLQPQPILPDSDEQDDASTGPALSTIAHDGGDATVSRLYNVNGVFHSHTVSLFLLFVFRRYCRANSSMPSSHKGITYRITFRPLS